MLNLDPIRERLADSRKMGWGVYGVHINHDIAALIEEVERLRNLNDRAHRIMSFHSGRCPLIPLSNFSGSEEHLAEYRDVMRVFEQERIARQVLEGVSGE